MQAIDGLLCLKSHETHLDRVIYEASLAVKSFVDTL